MPAVTTASELSAWVREARQRTFDLVADLSDEQLFGPLLPIINPLIWEIGHVAWFQEKWVLRGVLGRPPIRGDGDALYDSAAVHHDTRWSLPLPSREDTISYMREVRDAVLERLDGAELSPQQDYFIRLSVFHEDMHDEALIYTRQTLGYPAPRFSERLDPPAAAGGGPPLPGDCEVPGGVFRLGAREGDEPFVFDNEKWAHPVTLRPFAIAGGPVTQAGFLEFVEDDGYGNADFWSEDGWTWREAASARHPVYWERDASGRWRRRHFDEWRPLEPDLPVVHVNWHEAEAYCRWAGRRLPTEAEWEAAAAAMPAPGGSRLSDAKRRFPWGDDAPTAARANLDARAMGPVPVGACADGESAFGCRQMIGNVWEWTSTTFAPYPGFVVDPYREYSEPWFHTHKVLRGGAWTTRGRLLRNTWRNFYKPDRRDVWAGFRTCSP
jgi:iron(II)-dependent oxidoreductase